MAHARPSRDELGTHPPRHDVRWLRIGGPYRTGMPRCVLYWEARVGRLCFGGLGRRAGRIPVSDRGTFGGLSQSVSIRVCRLSHCPVRHGEMSEWLKEHAWKACVGETLPWVRIPLSPPPQNYLFSRNLPEFTERRFLSAIRRFPQRIVQQNTPI